MSELDKYSRYDPLAEHSPRPKRTRLTIEDTDEWLAKHGNGIGRIPANQKHASVWSDYGKQNVATLIRRHLNKNELLFPSDIADMSCRAAVLHYCKKMVREGELVNFQEYRTFTDAKIKNNQKILVSGFKRA